MGHNFILNRTSQFGTSCMVGVFILVLQYKDINSSQFVGIFKVKTTSLYGAKKGLYFCSFLVPRKVRFLAKAMFEQAQRCLFGLTKMFFSRSSKSAFSRHGNVRASSTLFIWLNENVRKLHFAVRGVRTKLFVVRLQVFCSRTTSILY